MPCGSARTLCVAIALCLACTPLRAPKEAPPNHIVQTPQQAGDRVAALVPSAPNYDHFEGVAFRNGCDDDAACHVGGCSSEICSADTDATSACVEYPDKPKVPCGCVSGQCVWYVTGGAAAEARAAQKAAADAAPPPTKRRPEPGTPSGGLPDQGQACADGRCAPGLECITFFGVGGPKAGTLTSCELRCGSGHTCPRGQACATISDGPGQVCRPESQFSPPPK